MKFKIFMVFLLIAMFSAGCGKKDNEIQGNNRKTKTGAELGTEQKAETELETGADETEEGQGTEKKKPAQYRGWKQSKKQGQSQQKKKSKNPKPTINGNLNQGR